MIPTAVLTKLATLGLSEAQAEAVASMLSAVETATKGEADAVIEKGREKVRVRVQKWRAKQSVTLPNVTQRYVTAHVSADDAPDLENKQTNKQENKEGASPSARSRRGSPIPDDFLPDIEAAVADGLSRQAAELMAKNFVDYWHAKPGKDGLKLDWPATWRVWYRRDLSPANRSGAPPRQARRNFADVAMDRMNGHGPKGVFSTDGDAERISAGKRESRPDDGNIRGGIAGRYITGNH
jgi:hypothetical protein